MEKLLTLSGIPVMESEGHPITVMTGSSHKHFEFEMFFRPKGMRFVSQVIDLPEIQGEPDEVVYHKCKAAMELLNEKPFIVEDTSLCFNALHGLPGPYVKWFYKKIGSLGLLKLLDGYEDKSARAVTIVGYFDGRHASQPHLFYGETKGTIVKPRGQLGFGWDNCFLPENSDKTYAELDFQEKALVSHRGKALIKLHDHLAVKKTV